MPDTPWVAVPAEDGEGWNVARIKDGKFEAVAVDGPVWYRAEGYAINCAERMNMIELREAVIAARKGGA